MSTTFSNLSVAVWFLERLIWCEAVLHGDFESTGSGTQSYKTSRRASGLSSKFCTVQVMLGMENLSALQNMRVSAFQGVWLCANIHKCIRVYTKCLQYLRRLLSGVSTRWGSTGACQHPGSSVCVEWIEQLRFCELLHNARLRLPNMVYS